MYLGVKANYEVILLNMGPNLARKSEDKKEFTEFLREWGGTWMWKDVRNSDRDFKWVIEALEEGTGTWVTDGSYMLEERQDACSACWIFHCQKT